MTSPDLLHTVRSPHQWCGNPSIENDPNLVSCEEKAGSSDSGQDIENDGQRSPSSAGKANKRPPMNSRIRSLITGEENEKSFRLRRPTPTATSVYEVAQVGNHSSKVDEAQHFVKTTRTNKPQEQLYHKHIRSERIGAARVDAVREDLAETSNITENLPSILPDTLLYPSTLIIEKSDPQNLLDKQSTLYNNERKRGSSETIVETPDDYLNSPGNNGLDRTQKYGKSRLRGYEDDNAGIAAIATRNMHISLTNPTSEGNIITTNAIIQEVVLDTASVCALVSRGTLKLLDAYAPDTRYMIQPIIPAKLKVYDTFAGPFIPVEFIWLWYKCSELNQPWTEKLFKVFSWDSPIICFDSEYIYKQGWLHSRYPSGPKSEGEEALLRPALMTAYHASPTKDGLQAQINVKGQQARAVNTVQAILNSNITSTSSTVYSSTKAETWGSSARSSQTDTTRGSSETYHSSQSGRQSKSS